MISTLSSVPSTLQSSSSQPLPRTFGRYQLFERIGAGGMAEIYLARARTELGGGRLVVVKQILHELSDNEKFAEMLICEAKLAAQLSHANIVQVFDLGRYDNVLFICMEYVDGFDLNEVLRRSARLQVSMPVSFELLIVTEMLRGLAYAHRRADDHGAPLGLVHRDVSPSNVLISLDGEVKLCDFGIARANNMTELLPDEAIKGKARYMSPEQARGETVDHRSDIFSGGIILWELLAGRKLYKSPPGGASLLELARAAEIPPLKPRQLPDEQELHRIVSRALSPQVQERYQSAQDFLSDLEAYVIRSKQMASPLRFGTWLRDNFEDEALRSRRAREFAVHSPESSPGGMWLSPTPPPVQVRAGDEVSGERAKNESAIDDNPDAQDFRLSSPSLDPPPVVDKGPGSDEPMPLAGGAAADGSAKPELPTGLPMPFMVALVIAVIIVLALVLVLR